MISFKQYIESFDTKADRVSWQVGSTFRGSYYANVHVEVDNKKYIVSFEDVDDHGYKNHPQIKQDEELLSEIKRGVTYEVYFQRADQKNTFDLTNDSPTGVKSLSSIVKVLEDTKTELPDLNVLMFSAKEDSRKSLYSKMIKFFARKNNLNFREIDLGDEKERTYFVW